MYTNKYFLLKKKNIALRKYKSSEYKNKRKLAHKSLKKKKKNN